jgi:hypothetical protein
VRSRLRRECARDVGGALALGLARELLREEVADEGQARAVGRAEGARRGVGDEEDSDDVAVGRPQLLRRVEADAEGAGDAGGGGEPRILQRVLDHEHAVRRESRVREGAVARPARGGEADARLHPDGVGADDADRGDGHAVELGDHHRDAVEPRLRGGAEDVQGLERLEALPLAELRVHPVPPVLLGRIPRSAHRT